MELKALNLSKDYSGKKAVDGVDISVISGHIIGLLGPNGAGKTTFFYMVAGLVASDSGQVLINDQDVTNESISERARKGLSYLPQEPSVFRRLSVKDNILAALEQRRDLNSKQKQEELYRLIKEFNLETLLEIKSIKLSGGERRRVEIARALAAKPRFLLLDEPFAGIDPLAVEDIQRIIKKLKDQNIGVLITDHNVRETLNITDRAYLLYEGKILKEGTAEELISDEDARRLYLGNTFN